MTVDRLLEINEAMNDASNILIPELSSHRPVPGRRGLQKAVGTYCAVYVLRRGGEAHPSKCLRFWYNEGERSRRLHESARRISSLLRETGAPYFCMQEYYERALRLSDGTVIPATVMDWMPRSLDQWLSSDDRPTSYEYADMARQMREISGFMKRNGITHGDLAPANILVGGDVRLKLIDFDSLEWPAMEIRCGEPGIAGVPRFNRKERFSKPRTAADDHLAQQLIHLMLLAYSRHPGLNTASSGEDVFLFDESEIATAAALRRSASYGRIVRTDDPELVHYLHEVEKALSCPYGEVRPLCDVLYRGEGPRRTRILKPAPFCGGCGHGFEDEEENYCPECGTRRERVAL